MSRQLFKTNKTTPGIKTDLRAYSSFDNPYQVDGLAVRTRQCHSFKASLPPSRSPLITWKHGFPRITRSTSHASHHPANLSRLAGLFGLTQFQQTPAPHS